MAHLRRRRGGLVTPENGYTVIAENYSCPELRKFHLKTTVNSKTSNSDKPLRTFLFKTSLGCYEANALFCVKDLTCFSIGIAGELYFNGLSVEWNV